MVERKEGEKGSGEEGGEFSAKPKRDGIDYIHTHTSPLGFDSLS